MSFQAVLFDMDGLLLDTEQRYMDVFIDLVADFGLSDPVGLFKSCIGTRSDRTREIIAPHLPQGVETQRFFSDWSRAFRSSLEQSVPIKPGVRSVLAGLKAKNIPMAVVTSTASEAADRELESADLRHNFQFVLGGDQVTRPKPDPEPYEIAASRIGFAPNRCLALEDTPTGATAAALAGCQTFQVPDLVLGEIALHDDRRPMWQRAETLGEAVKLAGL